MRISNKGIAPAHRRRGTQRYRGATEARFRRHKLMYTLGVLRAASIPTDIIRSGIRLPESNIVRQSLKGANHQYQKHEWAKLTHKNSRVQ